MTEAVLIRELAELIEAWAYGPMFSNSGVVWPGGENPGEGVCMAPALARAKEALGYSRDQRLPRRN